MLVLLLIRYAITYKQRFHEGYICDYKGQPFLSNYVLLIQFNKTGSVKISYSTKFGQKHVNH